MLDAPARLDRNAARAVLADADSSALACLIAVTCFVGDDILDEDGQPYTADELQEMLHPDNVILADGNLDKICGLLFTASGDEALVLPAIFQRVVAAVIEGDPFAFEDDNDTPTIPEVFWTLYQLELLLEEPLLDDLSAKVQRYIAKLAEEEAEDIAALQSQLDSVGDDLSGLEGYADKCLKFHKLHLATQLKALGCKAEWIADLDQDLAAALS